MNEFSKLLSSCFISLKVIIVGEWMFESLSEILCESNCELDYDDLYVLLDEDSANSS